MKKTEFIVQTFADFLNKNIANEKFKGLAVIIDYFNGAQGGCGCNRGKRIQAMNDIFNNKILNLDTATAEEIKNITNSTEIIFYNDLGIIIKQF